MANVYFNDEFEVCSIDKDPAYLYIDDVDSFLNDCGDDYITENVDEAGVYKWNDFLGIWAFAHPEVFKKIKALVKEINSSRQDNNSICWNILITLNTGKVIQTNSEPVPTNEVHEAIDILLRSSFFSKTIKEFKIVAV